MTYLIIIKNHCECNVNYRFLYGTNDELEQKLLNINTNYDLIFETQSDKRIELFNWIVTELNLYIDLQCIYLYVHDDGTTEQCTFHNRHTLEFNLNDPSLENEFLLKV